MRGMPTARSKQLAVNNGVGSRAAGSCSERVQPRQSQCNDGLVTRVPVSNVVPAEAPAVAVMCYRAPSRYILPVSVITEPCLLPLGYRTRQFSRRRSKQSPTLLRPTISNPFVWRPEMMSACLRTRSVFARTSKTRISSSLISEPMAVRGNSSCLFKTAKVTKGFAILSAVQSSLSFSKLRISFGLNGNLRSLSIPS